MVDLISNNVSGTDLKGVVVKLLPDSIAKDIEKACLNIYPLHDVYIRKVSRLIHYAVLLLHLVLISYCVLNMYGSVRLLKI